MSVKSIKITKLIDCPLDDKQKQMCVKSIKITKLIDCPLDDKQKLISVKSIKYNEKHNLIEGLS
jgi:hypothetical protein